MNFSLLQMANENKFVTLQELLAQDEEDDDYEILERIKVVAQEHMPEGWTDWKVLDLKKEDIFGKTIDSQILNKLRFCLPTVELAKSFDPEVTHLSEKNLKRMKLKLLDWSFTRALIISPPAITNKIRGSAAATEIFKAATKHIKSQIISREEVDRILESESEDGNRKRRGSSWSSGTAKRSKVEQLEVRMNNMFSSMKAEIKSLRTRQGQPHWDRSDEEYDENIDSEGSVFNCENKENDYNAYSDSEIEFEDTESEAFKFLPDVREAEPKIPEPLPEIKAEGIACHRFDSDGWNRVRYKDVEKKLHASPVFSSLKINPDLANLGIQGYRTLERQDGLLGTIAHGLLTQRKGVAEELQELVKEFPETAERVKKILNESVVKTKSDELLQFVIAHRAETIDMRRKAFKPRNDVLKQRLAEIPPSPTHLFNEKKLSSLIKDVGGSSKIFFFKTNKLTQHNFLKPFRRSDPNSAGSARGKRPSKRGHPVRDNKYRQGMAKKKAQKSEIRRSSHQRR